MSLCKGVDGKSDPPPPPTPLAPSTPPLPPPTLQRSPTVQGAARDASSSRQRRTPAREGFARHVAAELEALCTAVDTAGTDAYTFFGMPQDADAVLGGGVSAFRRLFKAQFATAGGPVGARTMLHITASPDGTSLATILGCVQSVLGADEPRRARAPTGKGRTESASVRAAQRVEEYVDTAAEHLSVRSPRVAAKDVLRAAVVVVQALAGVRPMPPPEETASWPKEWGKWSFSTEDKIAAETVTGGGLLVPVWSDELRLGSDNCVKYWGAFSSVTRDATKPLLAKALRQLLPPRTKGVKKLADEFGRRVCASQATAEECVAVCAETLSKRAFVSLKGALFSLAHAFVGMRKFKAVRDEWGGAAAEQALPSRLQSLARAGGAAGGSAHTASAGGFTLDMDLVASLQRLELDLFGDASSCMFVVPPPKLVQLFFHNSGVPVARDICAAANLPPLPPGHTGNAWDAIATLFPALQNRVCSSFAVDGASAFFLAAGKRDDDNGIGGALALGVALADSGDDDEQPTATDSASASGPTATASAVAAAVTVPASAPASALAGSAGGTGGEGGLGNDDLARVGAAESAGGAGGARGGGGAAAAAAAAAAAPVEGTAPGGAGGGGGAGDYDEQPTATDSASAVAAAGTVPTSAPASARAGSAGGTGGEGGLGHNDRTLVEAHGARVGAAESAGGAGGARGGGGAAAAAAAAAAAPVEGTAPGGAGGGAGAGAWPLTGFAYLAQLARDRTQPAVERERRPAALAADAALRVHREKERAAEREAAEAALQGDDISAVLTLFNSTDDEAVAARCVGRLASENVFSSADHPAHGAAAQAHRAGDARTADTTTLLLLRSYTASAVHAGLDAAAQLPSISSALLRAAGALYLRTDSATFTSTDHFQSIVRRAQAGPAHVLWKKVHRTLATTATPAPSSTPTPPASSSAAAAPAPSAAEHAAGEEEEEKRATWSAWAVECTAALPQPLPPLTPSPGIASTATVRLMSVAFPPPSSTSSGSDSDAARATIRSWRDTTPATCLPRASSVGLELRRAFFAACDAGGDVFAGFDPGHPHTVIMARASDVLEGFFLTPGRKTRDKDFVRFSAGRSWKSTIGADLLQKNQANRLAGGGLVRGVFAAAEAAAESGRPTSATPQVPPAPPAAVLLPLDQAVKALPAGKSTAVGAAIFFSSYSSIGRAWFRAVGTVSAAADKARVRSK
jgi:hypothetical protein